MPRGGTPPRYCCRLPAARGDPHLARQVDHLGAHRLALLAQGHDLLLQLRLGVAGGVDAALQLLAARAQGGQLLQGRATRRHGRLGGMGRWPL